MASNDGSQEPRVSPPVLPELAVKEAEMQAMADAISPQESRLENLKSWALSFVPSPDPTPALTDDEAERIQDGEPYCFRCGKPASSFPEYRAGADNSLYNDPGAYVMDEEGTYNPHTNRFACDACYIAIGMPADNEAGGWRAP